MDPIQTLLTKWREEPYGGGEYYAYELERALPDIIAECIDIAKRQVIDSFDENEMPTPIQWSSDVTPRQFLSGEMKHLVLNTVTTTDEYHPVDELQVTIIIEEGRRRALKEMIDELIKNKWMTLEQRRRGNSFCTTVKLMALRVIMT